MLLKTALISGVLFSALSSWGGTPHAIYRSTLNEDRLYSASPTEGPNAGYQDEGIAFSLFSADQPGTRPLNRCIVRTTGRHFLSLDPGCEGQQVEGPIGHIAMQDSPQTTSLIRFRHEKFGHIAVVMGRPENLTGWRLDGVLGYVLPPPGYQKPPAPTVIQDNQRYFGYYAGAMEGVGGPHNYIGELAGVSNLIFVQASLPNLEQKLIEVAQHRKKALVSVAPYFIGPDQLLQANYAQNFVQNVEPILKRHLPTILAFYGFDEPYHNGMNKGLTPGQIFHTQETMGQYVKSRFPQVPLAVILTVKELRDNHPLFPSFDWYGFDCYNAKMMCDKVTVWWAYDHLALRLDQMFQQDGKWRLMMSVPQAGHPIKHGTARGQADILAQVPHYRKIVKDNPRIKIVMPFLWQSFNDGRDNWTGARENPVIVETYKKFYHDLVNGTL